jgi:peptide deformylase
MSIYAIVKFGDQALRKQSQPVAKVDDKIRNLVSDMLASMYADNGLGLAAEQIGRDEAICVIDVPKDAACGIAMPIILINPEIVASEGEQVGQEGCLSFPGIYVNVKRAETVSATYMDIEGKTQTLEASGLLARAVQHERDHLNGVLLVDHMSAVQKVANAGKLKRLKREAKASAR